MTLLLELSKELEERLQEAADSKGMKVDEAAILLIDQGIPKHQHEEVHPVLHFARKMWKSVPESDWDQVPRDLATNLKSYLSDSRAL